MPSNGAPMRPLSAVTGLDRPGLLVLLLVSVYLAVTLGPAIGRTGFIEQDAALYCSVAERWFDGEGWNSLADRRGPALPAEFPRPAEIRTWWPAPLAVLYWATGRTEIAGAVVSLLSLIGAVWLGTVVVVRAFGVPAWLAATCVSLALMTRWLCHVATQPLTDAPSLLANIAVIGAVVARRPWMALGLLAVAVVVRWQNAVLLLPWLWAWPATAPAWIWMRRAAPLVALVAVAAVQPLWLEGLGVAVDPTHRDSLPRALRHWTLPLLLAGWTLRRTPQAAPFWMLAAAHTLACLAYPDSANDRPWLFANRHGIPLHFTAAALCAAVICNGTRWVRVLACVALIVVGIDNIRRPYKCLASREDVTGRPDIVLALDQLGARPLPADAVVLSHDCDIIARALGVPAIHLRGFSPDPPDADGPLLWNHLAARGATHALLTWQRKPVLFQRNAWLDAILASLAPPMATVFDVESEDGLARAVLLRAPR